MHVLVGECEGGMPVTAAVECSVGEAAGRCVRGIEVYSPARGNGAMQEPRGRKSVGEKGSNLTGRSVASSAMKIRRLVASW